MRARAIVETREQFGAAVPRQANRLPAKLRPPSWCGPSDDLHGAYAHVKRLFLEGQVVWGTLIQANSQLFEPGSTDCPAMLLFGYDPVLDDEVLAMAEIAHSLFELKDKQHGTPAARRFGEALRDELGRKLNQPLHESLSGGLPLYTTDTMLHRAFMPQGVLAGRTFPLLVHAKLRHSFMLPHVYWSDRILFEWGALAPPSSPVI